MSSKVTCHNKSIDIADSVLQATLALLFKAKTLRRTSSAFINDRFREWTPYLGLVGPGTILIDISFIKTQPGTKELLLDIAEKASADLSKAPPRLNPEYLWAIHEHPMCPYSNIDKFAVINALDIFINFIADQ